MSIRPLAYLCVSCDADPDFNPGFQTVHTSGSYRSLWEGVIKAVPELRRELSRAKLTLPLTLLLRADRQIREIYGDPGYCFQSFEDIWRSEQRHGSEIGWHPHLYRWDKRVGRWTEYLRQDDDLEVLAECLEVLRRHATITAVRTGWTYQSNKLLQFLDRHHLRVDTSAIPGTVQSGSWSFDWRGAPRTPYLPSVVDYRRPAEGGEIALSIVEMPVLVRSVGCGTQAMRYCLRNVRSIGSPHANLTDWKSSRYQGVMISGDCNRFRCAVEQILSAVSCQEDLFLSTYFHANELLVPGCHARVIANVRAAFSLVERAGYLIEPSTLTAAAAVARRRLDQTVNA